MTINRITAICAIALSIILPINMAVAADRGVFNGKSISQHELTDWEKKMIERDIDNAMNLLEKIKKID